MSGDRMRYKGGFPLLDTLHIFIQYFPLLHNSVALKRDLTVLQWSATTFADSIVFKIPRPITTDGEVRYHWDDVTYGQFFLDVERSARYWTSTLTRVKIPRRSVVGLW